MTENQEQEKQISRKNSAPEIVTLWLFLYLRLCEARVASTRMLLFIPTFSPVMANCLAVVEEDSRPFVGRLATFPIAIVPGLLYI